jgi:hypothetical protein
MTALDERLLELLAEEDGSAPGLITSDPRVAAESEARVRERMDCLVEAGLAYWVTEEWCEPTRWGRLYLDGDLDARHQPRPRPRGAF